MEKLNIEISDIADILETSVRDICKRVGGVSLGRSDEISFSSNQIQSLVVISNGDYSLSMTLCAEDRLLETMTGNMKRGAPLNEGDVTNYMTELLNIICGHIVSAINQRFQKKARFGIAKVSVGIVCQERICPAEDQKIYYYQSEWGNLFFEACFLNVEKTLQAGGI